MRQRLRSPAILLAVFVLLAATALGTYTRVRSGFGAEYFPRFGPALSFACGGPFADVELPDDPTASDAAALDGVRAFLNQDVQTLECSALQELPARRSLSPYQGMHRYSMYLVGGIWRVFGPSWYGFELLYGLMFGLAGLFGYLIAQRFVNRWLAAGVALMFTTSGSMMLMLEWFRDFSRAPFILGVIAIMAALTTHGRSGKSVLGLSAAAGLIAGIGLGFRTDALTLVPLFVAGSLLLFAVPWRAWSPARLLPALVFGAVFAASAFPVLRAYGEDGFSYTAFNPAQGLVAPFNRSLGLEASFYDHGAAYNDWFSHVVVHAHAARKRDLAYAVTPTSAPGARVGRSQKARDYYRDVALHFPADILLRWYRSVQLTATLPVAYTLPNSRGPVMKLRGQAVNALSRVLVNPLWLAVLGIGLAVVRQRRLGALLALIVVYYGVVNTGQFAYRNVFHHELWFWLSMAVVGSVSWDLVRRLALEGPGVAARHLRSRLASWWTAPRTRTRASLMLGAGVAAVALIPGSLAVTRAHQRAQIHGFVEAALSSAVPITIAEPTPFGPQLLLHRIERPDGVPQRWEGGFWGGVRYLAATFAPNGCGAARGEVLLVHESADWLARGNGTYFDRSFEVILGGEAAPGATASILFPAYYGPDIQFIGIAMDPMMAGCLERVAEIPAEGNTALTPYLLLNPGWEDRPAYLTLE